MPDGVATSQGAAQLEFVPRTARLNACQARSPETASNSCQARAYELVPRTGCPNTAAKNTKKNKDSKTRDQLTKKRTPLESLEFRTHHYFDYYFFTISIPAGSSTLARLNCNGAGTLELSPHETSDTPPIFQNCDKSPKLRERIKRTEIEKNNASRITSGVELT